MLCQEFLTILIYFQTTKLLLRKKNKVPMLKRAT